MVMTGTMVRRVALLMTAGLVLALLPAGGALAQFDRVAFDLKGETAVDFALRWSEVIFTDERLQDMPPTEVLLARDDEFADALASGIIQRTAPANRPLLYTQSGSLDPRTLEEIRRLGVPSVRILGLEGAVSEDVADQLRAEGLEVNRLGGASRVETAIQIAELFPDATTAIVARAFGGADPTQGFADSLAAGGWSAADTYPILLTDTAQLSPATEAHIGAAGYDEVIIVGGEAAVSAQVEQQLRGLVGQVDRVAGANRFETAVNIAMRRGFPSGPQMAEEDFVLLVDGQAADAWADGFAAALLSGLANPILLTNSAVSELPAATRAWMTGAEGSTFAQDFNTVMYCGASTPDGTRRGSADQCREAADLMDAIVVEVDPDGNSDQ